MIPRPVRDAGATETGNRERPSLGERLDPTALRQDRGETNGNEGPRQSHSDGSGADARRRGDAEDDQCGKPGEREGSALVAGRGQGQVALEDDEHERQESRPTRASRKAS